jgi:pSer/pThr/pTyr-binding forkhead associated (FHA) protein
VLQYNGKGEAFVYDLGSTHGTFINKRQVKAKKYAPLPVGGIIRFGQ